jgi:hypothetical protein
MKINASEPDLETLFGRIKNNSLDLQPDFQRADVWKAPKKKLLIDTILRQWQVPPVHVIYDEDECTQEVLDGQQRLTAIRDFMDGDFKVDGNIEPHDDDIINLNGLCYKQLPHRVKARFDRYSIRVYEIVEYSQGEPGELFNRLNESLRLTSSEKRNAYVGELRNQIKALVVYLKKSAIDDKFLGFSNQRLAHHDLFIKLCFLLENQNLFAKYTEKSLNNRARDDIKFDSKIINAVKFSIDVLALTKKHLEETQEVIHLTKATVFSWLFFIANGYLSEVKISLENFSSVILRFEKPRYFYKNNLPYEFKSNMNLLIRPLFEVFNERASSRVMTSSSLAIRDLIISIFYFIETQDSSFFTNLKLKTINQIISSKEDQSLRSLLDVYSDDAVWEDIV